MEMGTVGPNLGAAIAAGLGFWKQGISERKRGSTDAIAKGAGWGDNVLHDDGTSWDWCGMFVAACLHGAGLCATLRHGFFHVHNVEHYFTYHYEDRVARWVWDGASHAWCDLRAYHAARGSCRRWLSGAAIKAAAVGDLDILPGDVVLIDHQGNGKADHITMAERYDRATGLLVTLEGNGRGTVVKAVNPDGTLVEEKAACDAVVRNERDLSDPAQRKKIYGVGRVSSVDFESLAYDDGHHAPKHPPQAR